MASQKKKPGRPPGSTNKSKKDKVTSEDKERFIKDQQKKMRMKDEIYAIILFAVGIFLMVSLQTEAAGKLGHVIAIGLKGMFGFVAYVLPYYLIVYSILIFIKQTAHVGKRSIILFSAIFLMITIFNSAQYLSGDMVWHMGFIKESFSDGVVLKGGGVFGMSLGLVLRKTIGMTGLYILCIAVILISLLLIINTPFSQFIDVWKIKRKAIKEVGAKGADDGATITSEPVIDDAMFVSEGAGQALRQMKIIDYMTDDELFEKGASVQTAGMGLESNASTLVEQAVHATTGTASPVERGILWDVPANSEDIKANDSSITKGHEEKPDEIKIISNGTSTINYILPNVDLLSKPAAGRDINESRDLKIKAAKLEETLQNFGVNAKVLQVTKGPAVTRYEIQPNTGVKVSSIVRLADDIALNLEAKSIRIEAPIPGKAAVGIEVENERINMVSLRGIIESSEFNRSKSKITFAVGKDISGTPIVADLKGMPHMLIAGATGSGKSVCINTILISILYKARPDEVKLVLIDPKVVELGNYNGIPHLLIPVVTEPPKAAAALNWAVAEMTDRYKKFAAEGVKDLESYNDSIKRKKDEENPLPQIVIVIDELADLMMAAPSQVEEAICRLAQMARAAGMHLIVATQRPSVDVITGVIKANIPSRIAFAVSSQFDSRTIIDMSGAEKLVGKGDMLFNPVGMSKPIRVQGAFISDTEVHNVIDFVKKQTPVVSYSEDVMHTIDRTPDTGRDADSDELLQEAIETVVRAEQASVSMLQRRFRIGYNRAARLIDMMESRGIVGPQDGSRPRKVLITEQEYLMLGQDKEDNKE